MHWFPFLHKCYMFFQYFPAFFVQTGEGGEKRIFSFTNPRELHIFIICIQQCKTSVTANLVLWDKTREIFVSDCLFLFGLHYIFNIGHYRVGYWNPVLNLVGECSRQFCPSFTSFYRHFHNSLVAVGVIGYCFIHFLSQYIPCFFMTFKI